MHNFSQSIYSLRDFCPISRGCIDKPRPSLASTRTLKFSFKPACYLFLRISFKSALTSIQLCFLDRRQIPFWHVCMCVNVSEICKFRFHVLKQIKDSGSLVMIDTLGHGKRKLFPWDMCIYSFIQQVGFTFKKHNLCLLQLDWDNIYLEWGGEKREAKFESVFQTEIIDFRIADELKLGNMQRFFLGDNISKLSLPSKIPYISDISGGLYDIVSSTGRNKIRLSDIFRKGTS